jgi:hypothetical protein
MFGIVYCMLIYFKADIWNKFDSFMYILVRKFALCSFPTTNFTSQFPFQVQSQQQMPVHWMMELLQLSWWMLKLLRKWEWNH